MNQTEIREALAEAGGAHAYIDAADGETFILDGAFTLEQIAAMGRVAEKAMGVTALGQGDAIKIVQPAAPYFAVGDFATLKEFDGYHWWADFNDRRNEVVYGDGVWCVELENFEVIR